MPKITTLCRSLCLFGEFATWSKPQRLTTFSQRALHSTSTRPNRSIRPINSFRPLKSSRSSLENAITTCLETIRLDIERPEFLETLSLTEESFDIKWTAFQKQVGEWLRKDSPEVQNLSGTTMGAKRNLETRLRYLFFAQTYGARFTQAEVENQKVLADLRYPAEWYPITRATPRKVHLHIGPTNSGKTYHALKRLEEVDRGIYLGPLRLLAHEVYARLNAMGKSCALVTGEEQRVPEGEIKMWSCTVEMAPLNQALDVAVIDEIQMINHQERGWAWTQAFLGLQASEIHLCGEARAVPLIRELCGLVGDEIEIHEYQRLTPLKTAERSLRGNLAKNLEKGDCIVSFSVLGIHSLRQTIENATGRKCAIVYGSLPPETRSQQARLFNDPNNDYDFLVASDAIGMGLNLSIKRVIFESIMKNNGSSLMPLSISDIKQIAGRAGRYRSAHQDVIQEGLRNTEPEPYIDTAIDLDNIKPEAAARDANYSTNTIGYATTLEHLDYPYLKSCMSKEPEPITTAGLLPPSLIVERFANYFPPGTPFSYIMLRLNEISEIHPRFHLCTLRDQLSIADTIHTVKNLTIQERIIFCAAPLNIRDATECKLVHALAKCVADNESGDLLDLPIPLEILDKKPSGEREYLRHLEELHKMLVLYLWLSFRFPNVFTTRGVANYAKKLVEDAIEQTLNQFSFTEQQRFRIFKKREKAMMKLKKSQDSSPPLVNTGETGGATNKKP